MYVIMDTTLPTEHQIAYSVQTIVPPVTIQANVQAVKDPIEQELLVLV